MKTSQKAAELLSKLDSTLAKNAALEAPPIGNPDAAMGGPGLDWKMILKAIQDAAGGVADTYKGLDPGAKGAIVGGGAGGLGGGILSKLLGGSALKGGLAGAGLGAGAGYLGFSENPTVSDMRHKVRDSSYDAFDRAQDVSGRAVDKGVDAGRDVMGYLQRLIEQATKASEPKPQMHQVGV